MIKKTTALLFLLLGSVMVTMSQTKESNQGVKISGEISAAKSDVVLPEIPKLNVSDAEIKSAFFSDFDQPFRLTKTVIFSSFKQQVKFPNSGFVTSNPLTFDFNNAQKNQLANRFFILNTGKKVTYMGMGEFTQLNSSLGWQPSKKLTIDAGGFVGRQFEFATLSQNDILGASFRTKYDLTGKVQFNSWGQYASSGDNNTLAGFNTLFPHSGIGSSVSVRIKNLSKIEGGVEYQYNESTKVWNLESQGRISLHF